MRKILVFLFVLFSVSAMAQNPFSSTDTLRNYINRYVRNSAVESFQNLRLNRTLNGISYFLDSAYGGQVRSFAKINDTTARLITIANDTFDISTGSGVSTTGFDTLYIKKAGTGTALHFVDGDSLKIKAIQAGSNITLTQNADSSITIAASGGGGATDLDTSRTSTQVTVLSNTGNDAIIKSADAAKAGALSSYDWGTMADYYNIQKAGADSTGATDVSAYIIAGLATGRPVYIPKGTYLVSSAITVPDNALIFGDGNRSIIKTTTNITVFSAGDYTTFQNIKIIGNDGTSSQIGIDINTVGGVRLNSVWMVDLGVGVKVQATNSFYGTGGLLASDIVIESGGYGIWSLSQGEYMNVTAFHIKGCTYGIYNGSGNNNFSSGNITDCTYGFYLATGTNDGHATMSTVKVNHCTNSVYASSIANGYKFIGCMFYYGKLSVLSSSNVQFSECDINVNGDTIIVTSSSGTYFANCNFYGTLNWNVTGTKPLVTNINNNTSAFRMDLAGENKPADYYTSNGFATFGGSTIQRFQFQKPIFGANAPATYTHDMNTGSFNMDYAASQGLSDPFRVYNPSTTSGTVAAFMAGNLSGVGYYALRILNSGNLAIHQNSASARVHILGSTATANTAPLKFASGTNMTTPENGAFEYDGSHLYFTPSGATRKKFPLMPNSTASSGSILYGNGTDFSLLAAGTNGQVLTLSSGVPAWSNVGTEGTYTVTLTNTTNISTSSTNTTYYQRLGDVVHVWGEFTATATAAGVCEMGFSIPVSSAFGNTYDGNGTGASDAYPVKISSDSVNGRMKFRWTAPNTSSTTHSFHFTYKIMPV